MKLPTETRLPFFAYGLFKPGQLCYFRISDLVINYRDVQVDGILKERDGIPLLSMSKDSKVKGVLIFFHRERETDAYQRVIDIEPEDVYRWEIITTVDNVKANVLVGRKEDRG